MSLYSASPPAQPFSEGKPTLLVAWWITLFCSTIILVRLVGRCIRVEKLFLEDKIAAIALLPLFLRIICVHVVLLYGTNNGDFASLDLSRDQIRKREIGSRMALASRIFNAATLWALKFTTVEFFRRLAESTRQKLYSRMVILIRWTLVITFLAIIVSDLAECQPIAHYWQVLPDPGGQCRQGFVQLLTMGVSSVVIDILLIMFPIPVIVSSRIATKRKVLLVLLFCLGFVTVGITIYRLIAVIDRHGDQIVRTMWSSIELLAATTVANIVALGSFLRDSGVKKAKFKASYGSRSQTTVSRRPEATMATASRWDDLDEESNSEDKLWRYKQTISETRAASSPKRTTSPTGSEHSLISSESSPSSAPSNTERHLHEPRPPSPVFKVA